MISYIILKTTLMIEVPKALFLTDQIHTLLKNREITLTITDPTPHRFTFYSENIEESLSLLTGKKIKTAYARGGVVEIQIEDMLLIFTKYTCDRDATQKQTFW